MLRFLLSVFGVLVWAQAALAQALTVPPALAERIADGERVDVLALFDAYPDLGGADALATKAEKGAYVFAALTQYRAGYRPVLDALDACGIAYRELWSAGALYVPDADSALLRCLDGVEQGAGGLTLAPTGTAPLDELPAAPAVAPREPSSVTWGLEFIGAPEVWASGVRGEGVVIGGQDTGYDWDHPALKATYRGYDAGADSAAHDYHWFDAVKRRSPLNTDAANPCGYDVGVACDDGSHGTHTMGTMVGAVEGDTVGVAPAARWIGCRNMDRGDGTPQQYLECFQWFLAPTDLAGEAPRPELAPDVIANSWYCPQGEGCSPATYPAFERAVEALRSAGVVVVVSAGNDGDKGCDTLRTVAARLPGVIAVAAHDASGDVASFSSRGGDDPADWPDLAAPGVGVRSTVPGTGYGISNGTSMAGPHVAGVVALMIAADPALRGQVDTLEAMLLRSARPAPAPAGDTCAAEAGASPNPVFGHGYLDAAAAVAEARGEAGVSSAATHAAGDELVARAVPNPVDRLFTLHVGAEAAGARLQVVDAAGNVVAERIVSDKRTNIYAGGWAQGIYRWLLVSDSLIASGQAMKVQ